MTPHRQRVVIIGAGISGLCAAYFLRSSGCHVTLLEKKPVAGGVMQTGREDGWLIESGPNSALDSTPLFQKLFTELDLNDELVYADEAALKRYIVKEGILHPLPTGLMSFATSQLWSTKGKLRLFGEPFVRKSRREESVAMFVRRRLGNEFLDYAVDPFIAGIYAGDPEKHSARPRSFSMRDRRAGHHRDFGRGLFRHRTVDHRRGRLADDCIRNCPLTLLPPKLPPHFHVPIQDSIR